MSRTELIIRLIMVAVAILAIINVIELYTESKVHWINQQSYEWREANPIDSTQLYFYNDNPFPEFYINIDDSTVLEVGLRRDGVVMWRCVK